MKKWHAWLEHSAQFRLLRFLLTAIFSYQDFRLPRFSLTAIFTYRDFCLLQKKDIKDLGLFGSFFYKITSDDFLDCLNFVDEEWKREFRGGSRWPKTDFCILFLGPMLKEIVHLVTGARGQQILAAYSSEFIRTFSYSVILNQYLWLPYFYAFNPPLNLPSPWILP